MADSDSSEYEVERIVGEKHDSARHTFFKVKWLGYPDAESSWVPKDDMNCPLLIRQWAKEKALGQARKGRRSSALPTANSDDAPFSKSSKAPSGKKKRVSLTTSREFGPELSTSSPCPLAETNTGTPECSKSNLLTAKGGNKSSLSDRKESKILDSTTPNGSRDDLYHDDNPNHEKVLEENAYLRTKLESERAVRATLENKLRDWIQRHDALKKDIALIKFNQQLAGIRSSGGVARSSSSESSSAADASDADTDS